MSWTNTNDPNESQRTWPCHWTWPMRSRTLELSSWQQPKVFPSDDRGCALLPVSHLGFKVKSNAWLGLSSQQHNSHCIFQLLEQSVFGGCCCFFFCKKWSRYCAKNISSEPLARMKASAPQHQRLVTVCASKSFQNDLQNRPDKVGGTFKRSKKRLLYDVFKEIISQSWFHSGLWPVPIMSGVLSHYISTYSIPYSWFKFWNILKKTTWF